MYTLPDPKTLTDQNLSELFALCKVEILERAISACDPDALVEEGFEKGFKSTGLPVRPDLRDGILICYGARIDKSASSHECGFVRIDEKWVWEADDKIIDVIRNSATRNVQMRSVTLVAVADGTKVDVVYSKARQGAHELRSCESFTVSDGKLVLVNTRSVQPNHKGR